MIVKMKKLFREYIPLLVRSAWMRRKPSLYPFLEIKPRTVIIMLTDRCNLKCVMCNQWRGSSGKELSAGEWKKQIGIFKEAGIRNIHFTGGEPLLRPDLRELAGYCNENGLVCGMTTNGILLGEGILNDLADAGMRSIAVSVDALGEKYEKLRGVPNTFSRLEKNLELLSAAVVSKRLKAYVNFTLMRENISEFRAVKRFCDWIGLPVAVCLIDKHSYLFDLEENKNEFWLSSEADFNELEQLVAFLKQEKKDNPRSLIGGVSAFDFILRYFKDPLQKDIPCISSQERVFIRSNGDFQGGCLVMSSFGNCREEAFSDIQKKERYRAMKKNMFYKNCKGCSCGYLFNIQCFPRFVMNDILNK